MNFTQKIKSTRSALSAILLSIAIQRAARMESDDIDRRLEEAARTAREFAQLIRGRKWAN